jgi:glycosyltransferase involved in cell wall biosynthesis
MPKILVFIPCYRCEPQIQRVIAQFDEDIQKLVDTVMVVDNRSPDNTLTTAIEAGKNKLQNCHFIAWKNTDNYGLGGSHKAAFRYAIDNDFDHLIVLHGDDQADIRDLKTHLESGEHNKYDCFLGARFMPGSQLKGYSWLRTFGNRAYNLLFSIQVLKRVYDLGSGLNMYRLAAFKEFYYKNIPDDLTFNYVMLLGSYNRQQAVKFFPITWREEDQVANVRLFSQATRVLKLLAGYFFCRDKFLKTEMRAKTFATYHGEITYDSAKPSE